MNTAFASLFGICALIAVVPALQGCSSSTKDPVLTDDDLAQLATSEYILKKDEPVWQNVETLISDQSDSAISDAVNELIKVIGVEVFSSDVTASAVVEVTEDKLKISLAMGKISFKDGLIVLQRAEDDTRGPVFVLEFPLLKGKLSPDLALQKLLNASIAHIEGHVGIADIFKGSFKMLLNKEGYRFYLEMQSMLFANSVEAQTTLKITDTKEAHLVGELSLKFNEEFANKVSDLVRNAEQAAVDQISAAWEKLEEVKKDCPAVVDGLCKIAFDAAKIAFDAAKLLAGDAADKAVWILENVNNIFSIHSAKFDLLVDSTLSTNFEVAIDFTLFGTRHTKTLKINFDNTDAAAKELEVILESL